jgi:hypothetical protein
VSDVARIPLVDPDDPNLDPAVRDILAAWRQSGRAGSVPNVIRAMANHPGLLGGFGPYLYGPNLRITPAQRELAYLTASVINSCHY